MFWQRPVVNYDRHAYNAANQNWMIDQHPNGWMYFANNKGLLEFDGNYWNLYPIAHQAKMRSVKVGNDNRIYAGGQKEFGYFTPNILGGLDYHSLSQNIDKHTVSNIWNIHLLDNKVYFQGDRYIFCYDKGKVSAIDCDGVGSSSIFNNRIYFTNYKGLSWLKDKKIVHIPQSQQFTSNNIVSILPYQGKMLIVTPENGLYLYDGKDFKKPFANIDSQLSAHRVTCASIYQNLLAIGTINNGLYLINLSNNHVEKINIANGLQNKSLLSLKFDQAYNLWLGLDNGIDYIPLNTQLFFLGSKISSVGAGYCSQYYNSRLYLGTNQGVYTTSLPTSINTEVSLQFSPNMTGLVHCMYPYDNKLFCGGRKFFAVIDGIQYHKYDKRGVWHVLPINGDGNILLVGTYWGLEIMRKQNGNWNFTNKIEGCKLSAKTMFLEPESGNVWVANKSDGLWRLALDTSFKKVLHKKCYNSSQLPKGDNVYVTQIGRNIVIASRQGLFRYDPNRDVLVPYHQMEKMLDGTCPYSYIQQDHFGRVWYVTNGILKRSDINGEHKSSFLGDNMIEDFEDMNFLNYNQCIIGTEDGFAFLDLKGSQNTKTKINLQIRKLYVTNRKDSLIYGQSFCKNTEPVTIHYRDNSIRLEYGCNKYDQTGATTYSYRLKGFDQEWSEFTTNTHKEYTDLDEGSYTFEVKMLADGSNNPVVASLQFKILPPWYRTWWTYLFYLLLIGAATYYVYNIYKKGREKLIKLKDAELHRQKSNFEKDIDQKNKQIDRLEEEKLRYELDYKSKELQFKSKELQLKSDELVKSTLNVVRKNEILQKIKKDVESLSRSVNDGNLVNIRRGMLRLINQIDTNIEHDSDLDNFQSSFDAVHNDYFKKLDAEYPQLSYKDKMLCAYIKMNLMSKEIAPLLNISVRGVEIGRYRLRKKLGLDEKANLAEFLQKME